ncbi:MAG: 1-(5-phosphoribosyl)-5-[Lachnospiraceae bacterium]|nr:1-(5-phosphoribosyl)-5-[(5-phosphoribosylamino)methylideneamino]imidazole-4-carboxamide isomerase [Lachnospiraceae bacterium]
MVLYPAIDIKDGNCVRLRQGDFDKKEVFFENPMVPAQRWEMAGASFIHIVDLDGALKGHGVNREVIRKICRRVNIPIQLGGGIRTMDDLKEVFDIGVERAIIGTKAISDPDFVKNAVETFGSERIAVGIDAKNGMTAVSGWGEVSNVKAVDLGIKMGNLGVKTIIYTDISRDGMMSGPNIDQTRNMQSLTGLEVIASGGISCMEDLEQLYVNDIKGAIIGRALYENRIHLSVAISVFERK